MGSYSDAASESQLESTFSGGLPAWSGVKREVNVEKAFADWVGQTTGQRILLTLSRRVVQHPPS